MSQLHFNVWPRTLPRTLPVPDTSLWYNLEVSATRFPNKPAVVFYDSVLTYAELARSAERLAGFLQHHCGVQRGDRVALLLHNSPQFVIAYYAVLRADAMVVPVNSMSRLAELTHIVEDCGARVLITEQSLIVHAQPLLGRQIQDVVVATYADYLTKTTDLTLPEFVTAPRRRVEDGRVTPWQTALATGLLPRMHLATAEDLCVMPYTSGTTGKPKGCIHRHRNVMHTAASLARWYDKHQDDRVLSVLPFFHVTGMQNSMNMPILIGATMVVLARWDRDVAATLVKRYGITSWATVPTIIVDLLSSPKLAEYDLTSLRNIGGGGAAMPEAVAHKLKEVCGLTYVEGYGLSETMAPTHINFPMRPKAQCLGVPIFDTESRLIDPKSLVEVRHGEVGEIVTHGPQVFEGYWNNAQANTESFISIDGKRFLRTGDLARVDSEGYFFFVDRLKRMINVAGFKVWPAEVEVQLYAHPAVLEVAIVAKPDARRGETVKAFVVLRNSYRGQVTGEQLSAWAREHMAVYKVPHCWQFVDALPKSGSGKILWRVLQEEERLRATRASTNGNALQPPGD